MSVCLFPFPLKQGPAACLPYDDQYNPTRWPDQGIISPHFYPTCWVSRLANLGITTLKHPSRFTYSPGGREGLVEVDKGVKIGGRSDHFTLDTADTVGDGMPACHAQVLPVQPLNCNASNPLFWTYQYPLLGKKIIWWCHSFIHTMRLCSNPLICRKFVFFIIQDSPKWRLCFKRPISRISTSISP